MWQYRYVSIIIPVCKNAPLLP